MRLVATVAAVALLVGCSSANKDEQVALKLTAPPAPAPADAAAAQGSSVSSGRAL